LGLIAKLILASGDCNVGTREVDDFDWTEAGVQVVKGFLKEVDFKTSAWFYVLFVVLLAKYQCSISD